MGIHSVEVYTPASLFMFLKLEIEYQHLEVLVTIATQTTQLITCFSVDEPA